MITFCSVAYICNLPQSPLSTMCSLSSCLPLSVVSRKHHCLQCVPCLPDSSVGCACNIMVRKWGTTFYFSMDCFKLSAAVVMRLSLAELRLDLNSSSASELCGVGSKLSSKREHEWDIYVSPSPCAREFLKSALSSSSIGALNVNRGPQLQSFHSITLGLPRSSENLPAATSLLL